MKSKVEDIFFLFKFVFRQHGHFIWHTYTLLINLLRPISHINLSLDSDSVI